MIVRLDMELADRANGYRRHYAHREVDLPAIPRVDDQVIVSDGGWSEPVRAIWWDIFKSPSVHVELGCNIYIEYDSGREDLARIARQAGWTV